MTHSSEEQFCVYLYDRLVGRLHRRYDLTRFVFEDRYWDDPNRAVLGLRFEENPRARHQSKAQYGFRTVEDGSSQRRTGATLDGL